LRKARSKAYDDAMSHHSIGVYIAMYIAVSIGALTAVFLSLFAAYYDVKQRRAKKTDGRKRLANVRGL
jgi:hypothetical protein